MDFELAHRLTEDLNDTNLPRSIDAYEKVKCSLKIGQRVHWHYSHDKEFYDDMGEDVKEYDNHSGIVIPKNGITNSGLELEVDDVVIIIDEYPTEKCSPDVSWVALKRILDDDELLEMYIK